MKRRKENTETDDKKYLRIRGENATKTQLEGYNQETPPHMRRKPLVMTITKPAIRNTSAYAEKTG